MIEYIEGDIFSSPAQVIVNTVNTVGVMGRGLALAFKQRYPEMFACYRTVCEKRQLKTGKLMLWYAPDHWILLFPTKEHWRNPSKLKYIENGLIKFVNTYADKNITSIAFPRLGCGNGELNWDDVCLLMERYLKPLPIDIYVYLGLKSNAIPEHKT
jgi:O-acetyl-ADP-ribose deacetylase (regulator of RNase III)